MGTLVLLMVGGALVLAIAALGTIAVQRRLVYKFPPAYEPERLATLPARMVRLRFSTAEGTQTAFYLPPRHQGPPRALWLLWAGTKSRALSWRPMVESYPGEHTGFLMVEYPGFGFSQGMPSPAAIQHASEGALAALARHLATSPAALLRRSGVAGHSLGAASALEFAHRHPAVGAVVLVAPFTSLRDMARRRYGPVLARLLRLNHDNVATLAAILARPRPPRVAVFHAPDDPIIPMAMGRRLGRMARASGCGGLRLVPGGGHREIRDIIHPDLHRLWLAFESPRKAKRQNPSKWAHMNSPG